MEQAKWLKGRKLIETTCKNCGNTFKRALTEHNRSVKLKRNEYCSRKCAGEYIGGKNLGEYIESGNINNLNSSNRRDEYSGFRKFITRAKSRGKLGKLTVEDVKRQWDKQKGICPYTGIHLKLISDNSMMLASLDRIDSNKLYEINNIEFVSQPINLMKNRMNVNETIIFCKIISEYWKSKI